MGEGRGEEEEGGRRRIEELYWNWVRRSGERGNGRIQRSDGVGGRQPGLRALRKASLVGREGPEGKGATVDPFSSQDPV